MRKALPIIALAALSCAPRAQQDTGPAAEASSSVAYPTGSTPFPSDPSEPRLTNLRQLTHAGENAEAYWSADGKQLIFQAHWPGINECDQQYIMDVAGRGTRRVSNGKGRTTCGYFYPNGKRILYASTHEAGPACPPAPDMRQGYVWALYDYDLYTADPDGRNERKLFGTPGYDAEATISPDGSKIVFTSTRDGDLDLYVMDADGSNVKRLTDELGYDGGAFFSPDGTQIVYRAQHPETDAQKADYTRLLQQNLVRPTTLDIWVMNADGTNKRRVTHTNAASFAPYFLPNGRQIIFSSNLVNPRGREFDLYIVNIDGSGLERVTTHPEFDGFPMFSPDGKKLVFASNRGAKSPGETNIFIADWNDRPPPAPSGN